MDKTRICYYKQPYIEALEQVRRLQMANLVIMARAAVPARPNPNCFFCAVRKSSRFAFVWNNGVKFQVGVCTECAPKKQVLKGNRGGN